MCIIFNDYAPFLIIASYIHDGDGRNMVVNCVTILKSPISLAIVGCSSNYQPNIQAALSKFCIRMSHVCLHAAQSRLYESLGANITHTNLLHTKLFVMSVVILCCDRVLICVCASDATSSCTFTA